MTVTSRCRFSRRISFCGGNCSTVASEPRLAVCPDVLLKTVFSIVSERAARLRRKADANRVRPAVGDERIGGGNAVENRGGVLRNLGGREAESRRHLRVDLRSSWPAR